MSKIHEADCLDQAVRSILQGARAAFFVTPWDDTPPGDWYAREEILCENHRTAGAIMLAHPFYEITDYIGSLPLLQHDGVTLSINGSWQMGTVHVKDVAERVRVRLVTIFGP